MFKNNDSCLEKSGEEEPIFVLVARDLLAPTIVEFWITCANRAGVPTSKLEDASQIARAMREWQLHNGARLPQ